MAELQNIDKYQLAAEIGRGGFATVYRALDTRIGREVALKVIKGNFAREQKLTQRFEHEARTAAALHHPHIVTIYDFGAAEDTLFLAMRLIEGVTLSTYLEQNKRLSLEDALPILSQLAQALDYLGEQQLVHRDFKPANVMLEDTGKGTQVTLTDFGLVRSLEASMSLTMTKGGILGTPAYLAPEQADAQKWGDVTPLTDVYALGVTAYEMLVGQLPFVGNLANMLYAHAHETPPLPLELVPELGNGLTNVLMCVLSKDPVERYPTAGAMVDALQEVADTHRRQREHQSALERLLDQAHVAREAKDWLQLQAICVQILQIDRSQPDALSLMTEAMQGLQRENAEEAARRQRIQLYETGVQAMAAGEWGTAVSAFEQVSQRDPDFRDVQKQLELARDQMQRARLYDEAIAYGKAERWADACQTWVNVLHGRFNYHDGDAALRLLEAIGPLLDHYRELETIFQQYRHDLQQTRKTAAKYKLAVSLYEGLLVAMERKEWQQAVVAGQQLVALVPAFSSPILMLERASARLGPRLTVDDSRMIWRRDGKTMMRIPAGEFLFSEAGRREEVAEFWIDQTLVTNVEYKRFLDANPDYPPPYLESDEAEPFNWELETGAYPGGKADYPVVMISWQDATSYAEWAGKRLPTELEWEKAARGEDGRSYPWGDQPPTPELCNFNNHHHGPTPVGKYSPQGDSPYGCADMSGNVAEWVASKFSATGRTLRGGSWAYPQQQIRATSRHSTTLHFSSEIRYENVGIRCVVQIEEDVKQER